MKKLLIVIFLIIFSSFQLTQARQEGKPKDAEIETKTDTGNKENEPVKPEGTGNDKKELIKPATVNFDTIRLQYLVKRGDSAKITFDTAKNIGFSKDCGCTPHYKVLYFEWILVLAPLIVFLIIFFKIGIVKDFKLSEALTENEPPKKTIKNPEYNAGIIAASSSIPNLSVLFPSTIEVSNISPTIVELKAIAAAKEEDVSTVQTALDNAKGDISQLEEDVKTAQLEVDNAKKATSQLEADVKTAQLEFDNAKMVEPPDAEVVSSADKKLKDAQNLVSENVEAIKVATEKLEAANKKVSEKKEAFSKFRDLLPQVQSQAKVAKKIAEFAEEAATTDAHVFSKQLPPKHQSLYRFYNKYDYYYSGSVYDFILHLPLHENRMSS